MVIPIYGCSAQHWKLLTAEGQYCVTNWPYGPGPCTVNNVVGINMGQQKFCLVRALHRNMILKLSQTWFKEIFMVINLDRPFGLSMAWYNSWWQKNIINLVPLKRGQGNCFCTPTTTHHILIQLPHILGVYILQCRIFGEHPWEPTCSLTKSKNNLSI